MVLALKMSKFSTFNFAHLKIDLNVCCPLVVTREETSRIANPMTLECC